MSIGDRNCPLLLNGNNNIRSARYIWLILAWLIRIITGFATFRSATVPRRSNSRIASEVTKHDIAKLSDDIVNGELGPSAATSGNGVEPGSQTFQGLDTLCHASDQRQLASASTPPRTLAPRA